MADDLDVSVAKIEQAVDEFKKEEKQKTLEDDGCFADFCKQLRWCGEWSGTKTYSKGHVVQHLNEIYVWVDSVKCKNTSPVFNPLWQQIIRPFLNLESLIGIDFGVGDADEKFIAGDFTPGGFELSVPISKAQARLIQQMDI